MIKWNKYNEHVDEGKPYIVRTFTGFISLANYKNGTWIEMWRKPGDTEDIIYSVTHYAEITFSNGDS